MTRAQKRWSGAIYDYEDREIVDEEIAEVDLESGEWVRCQYCNSQISSQAAPFSAHPWSHHKRTSTHRKAVCTASSCKPPGAFPATQPQEYSDFAAAMMDSIEKDTDYLVFYRKELAKRAREEVRTKELIQKMAILVSDQQDDIDCLSDEVNDLKEIVQQLQLSIQKMSRHDQGNPLSDDKNTDSPPPSSPSNQQDRQRFIEIFDSDDDDEESPVSQRPTPSKRNTLLAEPPHESDDEEMDMFDDAMQLMPFD